MRCRTSGAVGELHHLLGSEPYQGPCQAGCDLPATDQLDRRFLFRAAASPGRSGSRSISVSAACKNKSATRLANPDGQHVRDSNRCLRSNPNRHSDAATLQPRAGLIRARTSSTRALRNCENGSPTCGPGFEPLQPAAHTLGSGLRVNEPRSSLADRLAAEFHPLRGGPQVGPVNDVGDRGRSATSFGSKPGPTVRWNTSRRDTACQQRKRRWARCASTQAIVAPWLNAPGRPLAEHATIRFQRGNAWQEAATLRRTDRLLNHRSTASPFRNRGRGRPRGLAYGW